MEVTEELEGLLLRQEAHVPNICFTRVCEKASRRATIALWLFRFVDALYVNRSAAVLALAYLDRAQGSVDSLDVATCLFLASKVTRDGHGLELSLIAPHCHVATVDILQNEVLLLRKIDWKAHVVLPEHFASLLDCSNKQTLHLYLDLAAQTHEFVLFRPSILALAALVLTEGRMRDSWKPLHVDGTEYKKCLVKLRRYLSQKMDKSDVRIRMLSPKTVILDT